MSHSAILLRQFSAGFSYMEKVCHDYEDKWSDLSNSLCFMNMIYSAFTVSDCRDLSEGEFLPLCASLRPGSHWVRHALCLCAGQRALRQPRESRRGTL